MEVTLVRKEKVSLDPATMHGPKEGRRYFIWIYMEAPDGVVADLLYEDDGDYTWEAAQRQLRKYQVADLIFPDGRQIPAGHIERKHA